MLPKEGWPLKNPNPLQPVSMLTLHSKQVVATLVSLLLQGKQPPQTFKPLFEKGHRDVN